MGSFECMFQFLLADPRTLSTVASDMGVDGMTARKGRSSSAQSCRGCCHQGLQGGGTTPSSALVVRRQQRAEHGSWYCAQATRQVGQVSCLLLSCVVRVLAFWPLFAANQPGLSGAEVSAEEGRGNTRGNTRRVSCVCVCVCVNVAARKHRHDKVLATSSATCSANVKGLLWLTRSKPGCPRRLSWAMTTLPT